MLYIRKHLIQAAKTQRYKINSTFDVFPRKILSKQPSPDLIRADDESDGEKNNFILLPTHSANRQLWISIWARFGFISLSLSPLAISNCNCVTELEMKYTIIQNCKYRTRLLRISLNYTELEKSAARCMRCGEMEKVGEKQKIKKSFWIVNPHHRPDEWE